MSAFGKHLRAADVAGDVTTSAARISILRNVFPVQSFFDNTQLAQALLMQQPNEPIVNKQPKPNLRGRAIGLHPTSQTPVAVKTFSRGGATSNNIFTLTPGQFILLGNHGFEGLEWGLPYGWRGGGIGRLVIADDEESFLGWSQSKVEVLFHRIRVQIVADANPTVTPAITGMNWPLRFPWSSAFRFNVTTPTSPFPQAGLSTIAIEPSRTLLRLRVNNLAAPAAMRVIMQGLDDLDIGSDGVTTAFTDFSVEGVNWPAAVGASTPFPTAEIREGLLLDGGDQAVATFTNLGNAALLNQFVDCARYGRI